MKMTLLGVLISLSLSPAALADPVLDAVKSRKELRIATDPVAAPLNVKTPKGTYEGIEVELANEIAKKIGVKVTWVNVKWEKIPETVKNGKADLGMNGLFVSENGKEGDWGVYSAPYLDTGLAVAYPASKGTLTMADLKKRAAAGDVVGIINDPQAVESFKKQGIKTKVYEASNDGHLTALEQGKIPFAAYDLPIMKQFVVDTAGKFKVIPGVLPGSESSYAILIKKEGADLKSVVDESISAWKKSPATLKLLQSLGL